MEIIHVSAECYPYAKVGGLADVAPTILTLLGLSVPDIMTGANLIPQLTKTV